MQEKTHLIGQLVQEPDHVNQQKVELWYLPLKDLRKNHSWKEPGIYKNILKKINKMKDLSF